MYKLRTFMCSLLLSATLSCFVYPQNHLPQAGFQLHQKGSFYRLSYDEILDLLDKIESGELEQTASDEDLEQITHFVASLAREGILPGDDSSTEDDIEKLLQGDDTFYEETFSFGYLPAFFNAPSDVILCKNWVTKQWRHVKHFVKKNKKAILIGTAVVVAAAAVVVAVVAASVVGAAAAGAAAITSNSDSKEDASSTEETAAPLLKATLDEHIVSFKETLAKEQFFEPTNPLLRNEGLSWEDNGRALGSLWAHDSFKNLSNQISECPSLSREIQSIASQINTPKEMGHSEIDLQFSTSYSSLYGTPQEIDFNTISYQMRGEMALEYGYLNQAVYDLGKAIELGATSPIPYLERGIAYFGLGQYHRSLEDYEQFTSQSQTTYSLSVSEFSLGFAKGLPKGIYESGEGLFLFLTDFVKHPIHTSQQIVDSIATLVNLVRNDEWGVVGESLSPEIYQLVTQWDNLPSDERGELAGYAVGKHGADILVPGALVKVASKSVKSAQELVAVCKSLQIAQETLVLETAAEMGNSAKIMEVIHAGQATAFLGEELGFSAQEMGQLKQTGKLEGAINSGLEKLVSQSESEVLKDAISHNKHAKMVRDYLEKPSKEIQKGINSYEKQIAIHKDKIANPVKYYPDWDKLDPRQREALINKKWPAEIHGYEEQRSILQSILNERLSHE